MAARRNYGTITGGTFKSYVENYFVGAVISGGVFTDASVNNDGGSITGGVFRSFTMDSQSKELTITGVVDLDKDFALAPLTIALDGESIKSITVAEDAAFDAGSGVSVPVTNNGKITGGAFSDTVTNNAGGEINGGDFRDATVIDNGGTFDNFTMDSGKGALTITGAVDLDVEDALDPLTIGLEAVKEITVEKIATFDAGENTISAAITNDGAITGGTIDGEIRANTGTIKGCAFGPNATVISNEGIIELSITVDERDRKVNYGADVLDALGMSPTGLWYRENADGTRSPVKEGETFASLQTEAYTSQILMPKPKIEIDYINETFSVTLTEEEEPEGLDVTDLDIDFALEGQEDTISTGMYGLSCSWFLGQIGASWGIDFPSFEDTTLEVYYTLPVTNDDGEVIGTVYGESVEWAVPVRPDIYVTNIQPGYNEMDITFETIPHGIESYVAYLQSASDPEIVIYDDADGVVDGHIEGLTEGTEYIVHFRVPPTEDSFASFPYSLKYTFATFTRTHLSVNAAAGAWEWQPGFSLNAEDCFAAQVTLQGEMDVPEKDKFVLTATKDGREVPFPLTEPGTYTITASLSADVADDYVLDNASFTVSIVQNQYPMNSRDITVRPIPAQTYTGGAIYPAVSVWHGETHFVMGEDYTVSYQNNVNVGVATIVITGMGDYAGTRLAFFDIVPPQAAEEEEKPSGGSGSGTDSGSGTSGDGGETTETTGEAQQNRLVVDETGAAMPHTYSTVEVLDEETGAVTARKLVIVADPVRDESGAIVYDADGQPLYEARSLLLSRELLDAIAARGYTHIRFVVKDAALEWPIAEMTEDGYAVRLAPMEADELSQAEKDATGEAETLTGSYRARITAMIEGKETDVTNAIPSLTAIFGAQSVRELADGEAAQLLLVPGDGEPEVIASAVQYIEATQAENARYEAPLMEAACS